MQLSIRSYHPSDKDAVRTLFTKGRLEHINPSFYDAMISPLYLAISLALCVTGYFLGSVVGAVVLPGGWVGLIYYSCYQYYSGFVRKTLQTDMQDIPRYYMSRPDDCFWVAEADVDGRTQIVGIVAVVAKQSGNKTYGELHRMTVSPSCRRAGLGFKMTSTVIDFCKERGFTKVVLVTIASHTAAVDLYQKCGFSHVRWQRKADDQFRLTLLSRIKNIEMEKHLSA
ncbi:probable N-acetyltransferase camello [Thalassophryne amazonica]|uniref:probable N-acetyltransferase camello n=1 Tax=Thalassophryne amazonica TaxID=390379 RepID=UPI00147124D9|nr:probable N-acetyltransferase camello [Thalassophryne amazonica]